MRGRFMGGLQGELGVVQIGVKPFDKALVKVSFGHQKRMPERSRGAEDGANHRYAVIPAQAGIQSVETVAIVSSTAVFKKGFC
ncbi:hypothetical protein GCM10017655_23800 [Pseudomonas turukhanskensis]|uniref:Uncharacterized protein n=1 Tax=Pseudomonas turukhanskensis TaxID=1806536 RepID=A0A9W6K9A0_9PSED|nr:hypothetical protein GCM10017655_23800 [Pseudomonas turukhanskensis]